MANPKYSRYYTYIEPMAQNKIVRSYAPYIFSLISIIIFGLFAIKPTISTISELQKEVADKQQLLEKLQKKNQDIDLAKQNLDQISADNKTKINTALPNSPQVTDLVSSLQSTAPKQATGSALQVQSVVLYDKSATSSAFTQGDINFVFNNQGGFADLVSELQSISKLPRIVKIGDITMTKGDSGGLTLSINADAYYKK